MTRIVFTKNYPMAKDILVDGNAGDQIQVTSDGEGVVSEIVITPICCLDQAIAYYQYTKCLRHGKEIDV